MLFFGLDKVSLSNISIKKLDIQFLEIMNKHDEIKLTRSCDDNINFGIKDLKIEDENFGILTSGYKIVKGRYINWVILELNKSRVEETNMIPLSIEDFRNIVLKRVLGYIKEAYKIELNVKEVKFKVMEVNVTFILFEEYCRYNKVFEMMIFNAPKTYKQRRTETNHRTGNSSFYVKNNSIEVKIYNKTLELKEKQGYENDELNGCMCRIEYKLKDDNINGQKISSVFGTNRVYEIQTEQLKEFFLKQFKRDFVEPMNKMIKKQKKEMVKRLKEKKKCERYYVNKTMLEMSLEDALFDIEIVCEAIKEVDKKNYKKRQENAFRNVNLESIEGNIKRFEEVVTKVNEMEKVNFEIKYEKSST